MILALNGKIPENKFKHDANIKNKYGKTVCYYLWDNGVEVLKCW